MQEKVIRIIAEEARKETLWSCREIFKRFGILTSGSLRKAGHIKKNHI